MEPHGASDPPASGDSDASECVRCGIRTPVGVAHCPGCLLRLGLEYDENDLQELTDDATGPLASDSSARRLGAYSLLEEIGRGGMGVIYRARHEPSGATVALKCLLDYHIDSRETVARFRREASAAAMLKHPNILPVFEVGDTSDGVPFFSMQLVTGGTLHRGSGPGAERDARESVLLMAKVADAVHFAHQHGILHRDLKPGNILLSEQGEPWVTDFGLAKWLHEPDGLTRTLLVFGTPGYIAPEQAHGPAAQLSPAADVYSIGAMLFELLAGRAPFLGDHALAVLRKAAEEPAPKLRSVAPRYDRQLETICARCLEREPSARYQSAAELAADLRHWLEGRRIKARPVAHTTHAKRWVARNRALTAALAVAALCSAFAIIRGVHNRGLTERAQETLASSRSAGLLPVLDLDRGEVDEGLSTSAFEAWSSALSALAQLRFNRSAQPEDAGSGDPKKLREIARVTNSRTVIAFSKRTDPDGARVWCRVVDGRTGNALAVRSFAGESAQGAVEAATTFATELSSLLSRRDDGGETPASESDPGLKDPMTREWILAGRRLAFRYTPRELDHAISLFEKALEKQPASHTAHAYVASAYVAKGHFYSDLDQVRRGAAAARRAVELAPESPDAHRTLAGALYVQGDLHEALEHSLQTAALCGTDDKLEQLIGMTLRSLGAPERAVPWYRRAASSAAEPASAHVALGDCWKRLDDDEQAFGSFARAGELQPDLPLVGIAAAHLHLIRGEFDEARRICAAAADAADLGGRAQLAAQIEFFARNYEEAARLYSELGHRHVGDSGSFYGALNYESAIGRSLQALGKSAEAEEILTRSLEAQRLEAEQQPRNSDALYRLAAVEASLGLHEPAVEHLRAAADAGWVDHRSLALDPRFDSIRGDERLEKLLAALAEKAVVKRRTLINS